ncbi:MAG: hypothetical protein NE334_03055 [Lentisphaeraceae bacterium]|nr:hypothetical protein [Lentisphaeraceae bacterium]
MSIDDNIWYAVNQTRIVDEPDSTIETFGMTRIKYFIVTEMLDAVNKIKIHEGIIVSEKPAIITPSHFAQQLVNGFGEEAREYAQWLSQHGEFVKILQYGLQISKEEIKEEVTSGTLEEVTSRVRQSAEADREITTVIQGVENMWEVSLMKFMQGFIAKSVGRNFNELQSHQQTLERQAENQIFDQIEEEFYNAQGDKDKLNLLGQRLQAMGVFGKYEDRFFALLRECS